MKNLTIAEKRAQLYKEWILATLSNDENYYFSTLYTGIPDGDTEEEVLEAIKEGVYDYDLDNMLAMYNRVKNRYKKSGWYVEKEVIYDEEKVLEKAGSGLLSNKF